jgi:hypothetical protein
MFSELPHDLIVNVLLYLDLQSFARFTLCNKHIHKLDSAPLIWYQFYQRELKKDLDQFSDKEIIKQHGIFKRDKYIRTLSRYKQLSNNAKGKQLKIEFRDYYCKKKVTGFFRKTRAYLSDLKHYPSLDRILPSLHALERTIDKYVLDHKKKELAIETHIRVNIPKQLLNFSRAKTKNIAYWQYNAIALEKVYLEYKAPINFYFLNGVALNPSLLEFAYKHQNEFVLDDSLQTVYQEQGEDWYPLYTLLYDHATAITELPILPDLFSIKFLTFIEHVCGKIPAKLLPRVISQIGIHNKQVVDWVFDQEISLEQKVQTLVNVAVSVSNWKTNKKKQVFEMFTSRSDFDEIYKAGNLNTRNRWLCQFIYKKVVLRKTHHQHHLASICTFRPKHPYQCHILNGSKFHLRHLFYT